MSYLWRNAVIGVLLIVTLIIAVPAVMEREQIPWYGYVIIVVNTVLAIYQLCLRRKQR